MFKENNKLDNIVIKVLEELKSEIVSRKNLSKDYLASQGNKNGFETLMKNEIIDEFNQKAPSLFSEKVELKPQFGHHFPDIDLKVGDRLFGIELKSRNNGSWSTLGGSVIESISSDSYEEIYLLFASFNKKKNETSYRVRYMPYWKAADAIKVTHSPRFQIDLDNKESVFNSNEEYKEVRQMNDEDTIRFIHSKLNAGSKKLTWYSNLDKSIPPTDYSSLNQEKKKEIQAEALILFPIDLLKTDKNENAKANYHYLRDYMLTQHYILITRDNFSAGGQYEYKGVKFPKIIRQYREYRNNILKLLNANDPDFVEIAYKKWNWPKDKSKTTLEKDFKNVLDDCGKKYLSDRLLKSSINKLSDLVFS